jgi:hypothetical protein
MSGSTDRLDAAADMLVGAVSGKYCLSRESEAVAA